MSIESLLEDIENSKNEVEIRLIEQKMQSYHRNIVYMTKSLLQLYEHKLLIKERMPNGGSGSEEFEAIVDEYIEIVKENLSKLKL